MGPDVVKAWLGTSLVDNAMAHLALMAQSARAQANPAALDVGGDHSGFQQVAQSIAEHRWRGGIERELR